MSRVYKHDLRVGVGNTVEYGIYSSIKMNNPNFITFIVTAESKSTLERMISKERLRDICQCEEFTISNREDLDNTFSICEQTLRSLFSSGFTPSDIIVDITSGTKIMSAAIASVAILYKLYSITYVGGVRDEAGIVIQGSEKPKEIKPMQILYRHELNLIKKYFSIF